nr:polyprotein [Colletotrichum truncatum]KAF6785175.1 polyprotein [Colletotrichum truncatum]
MSFRVLMAVAARFDLELLQYDAVNAFVYADLDETVYMELPPGYRVLGRILRLRKALYGLRRSPLLWQRHLEKGLVERGFERVAGENCCWQKGEVMFFFYVDDCVLAFPRARKEAALREVSELQKRYHFEGGGDLQWFLGIEVIRDRATRRLWLSQAVYAEKTANALEDGSEARLYTPMVLEELLPYEGEASAWEVNQYQKKVGTLLYAVIMTRPDVAFAASRLARFNQNPGPKHQRAADRALAYLYSTRYLCLEYGCEPGSEEDTLIVASDASFVDNSLDRKSS